MRAKNISKIFTKFLIIGILLFNGCEFYMFDDSEIEFDFLTFSNTGADQDWSPDGNKIVYNRWVGNHTEVWIVDINTKKTWKVKNGFDPTWHPKDDIIAYEDNGVIFTMRSNGEIIEQLTTNSGYFYGQPAWNHDGKKIAYTVNDNIWIMNADGTEKKQLTFWSRWVSGWHSFSYDGSQIVYIKSRHHGADVNEIWIMNSDGTKNHQIYSPGNSRQVIFQRAWNKDNKIIFMREMQGGPPDVWIMNSDGSNVNPLLKSRTSSYNDPVWDIQGENIAINCETGGGPDRYGGMICVFNYQ